MAAWTALDVNSRLPGEPWTSAKGNAVYENPIAMAEGASGAPRIATRTHTFSRSSAGSTTSVFSDGDEYGGLFVQAFAKSSDPSRSTITVAVSDDGSSYSSELMLCNPAVNETEFVRGFIDFATGSYTLVGDKKFASGTIGSLPSGAITHVRFTVNLASGVSDGCGGIAEFQGGESSI